MLSRKTIGRVIIFGIGYVLGARAGQERYTQIQSMARNAMDNLRSRYETDQPSSAGPTNSSTRDEYDDITLGD